MIHCVHAIIKNQPWNKHPRTNQTKSGFQVTFPGLFQEVIIESLTKPRDLGSIPSHFPWLWSQDPTALLSASRWSLDGDRLAEHLAAVLRPSAEEAGMYLIFYSFLLESVTFGFNKLINYINCIISLLITFQTCTTRFGCFLTIPVVHRFSFPWLVMICFWFCDWEPRRIVTSATALLNRLSWMQLATPNFILWNLQWNLTILQCFPERTKTSWSF